ncbi:NYN domain-containing protein [Chloroflexota bacterium]
MAEIKEYGPALAVLIDADNANPAIVEGLLAEIAKLGFSSVKRIYGDWTNTKLSQWKTALLEYSIQPIQQFAYTTGKNATDSAMIIDAMDLLYSGNLDGFCLVSSDSDFTRLASRIRESGKIVYGFGEQKTPRPFVTACDRFIYTEVFTASSTTEQSVKKKTAKELGQDTKLINLFKSAIDAASDENGWANLGPVGANIIKQAPDFDPRNYGYTKLSDLVTAVAFFKLERREKVVFIKNERPK